ncbi:MULTISPECIES: PRC-barrel domain-containing protein [Halomonadaceae]|uniref:PRC-barrel domain-containing protein n=1 Tax=Halomonadaceae TaxID=28256 RepID=UPI0015981595|nr:MULTISPECIES: PRC-barrel domain-containing protein [Halomonas]QJQ93838.1 PRC-barrel domain-containing protein [Halomonas sp. PA5]
MKKSISMTLGTMLVPAVMFGAGSVVAGEQDANAANQTANVGQNGDNFMSSRPDNAFYADQLIGTNVQGQNDDDDFGTVNDLIIDEDGQIQAVIVGVGGFLGMGDRDVAISWDSLDVRRDADNDDAMGTGWFGDDYVIRTDISSEELENAPEYERDNDN